MTCELGDGLALLHHDTGTFFVLDEVGAFIWKRLARPATADELTGAVMDAFEAPPDKVGIDVRNFIQSMVDAQLCTLEDVR